MYRTTHPKKKKKKQLWLQKVRRKYNAESSCEVQPGSLTGGKVPLASLVSHNFLMQVVIKALTDVHALSPSDDHVRGDLRCLQDDKGELRLRRSGGDAAKAV